MPVSVTAGPTSTPLAAVMLALSSGAFGIFNVAVGMRQRHVPEHLLGRVTSLYMAVAGGATPRGLLCGGEFIAERSPARHRASSGGASPGTTSSRSAQRTNSSPCGWGTWPRTASRLIRPLRGLIVPR